MKHVRGRTNLEFIDHSQAQRITMRQSKIKCKNTLDRNSTFSVYKFDKEKIIFDKPTCLAVTVLQLSKLSKIEF